MRTILFALPLLLTTTPPAASTPSAVAMAEANNRFCLDLYHEIRSRPGNLAFSPYSINAALTMTYAGARGQTEEEMARTLHLPFGQDRTHEASGALRASLIEAATAAGDTLWIANRLWAQKGTNFLKPFLRTTRKAFGADLETVDFVRKSEKSRLRINDWTREQTRGKIPNLLSPGSITNLTRLVLTNAIYFKAYWQDQFKAGGTRDGIFYVSPAESLKVPMMHRKGRYLYAQAEGTQVLIMDYVGKRQSMVILLPDALDGLEELESALSFQQIATWIGAVQDTLVLLTLPRFHVASSFSLSGALSSMGMPSAFRLPDADFAGMTGRRDLFVSAVVHKAVVDVAERGTEAAAATAVGMELGIPPRSPTRPVYFTADHPFLFLIQDKGTGCILFIGRVQNPIL